VDENWNSAYPYVVGPTFYGVYSNRKVTTITEPVTVYNPGVTANPDLFDNSTALTVFPNPATDFAVVQVRELNRSDLKVELLDLQGKLIREKEILQGSTFCIFDLQTLYAGYYSIRISGESGVKTLPLLIRE
jgi:hypothetical protein